MQPECRPLDRACFALNALAGACQGLPLTAIGEVAAGVLTAAAVPPTEQLPVVLRLASDLQDSQANIGNEQHEEPAISHEQQQQQLRWVLAAAAVRLLHQQQQPAGDPATLAAAANGNGQGMEQGLMHAAAEVMRQLVLPLLAAHSASAAAGRQAELQIAAAELVAGCRSWGLGLLLLQAAVPAAASSPGIIGGSASEPARPGSESAVSGILGQLPPGMRMQLAATVVDRAVLAAGQHPPADGTEQQGLAAVLQHAATSTHVEVLGLLQDPPRPPPKEGRQPSQQAAQPAAAATAAAMQQLLAATLRAAMAMQQEEAALQQLWQACKHLLSGSKPQRQQGLALLLRFAAPLLAQPGQCGTAPGGAQPAAPAQQQQWQGVQRDANFWQLLRCLLSDRQADSRKLAAHVLQQALREPEGQLAPAWQSFFKLMDCLDELAPHLVQDAWGEIERVHPGAAAAAGASAEQGGRGASALEWDWEEVVWTRGLRHEHQQVQRLILASFLDRDWQPGMLAKVPSGFVLSALLPAAGQAHLWRGKGAAALQQQTAAWVGRFASVQPPTAQQQLLLDLLQLLGGGAADSGRAAQPVQQQLRPLVQTAAAALLTAAQAVAVPGGLPPAQHDSDGSAGSAPGRQQWQMLFLLRLQRATQSLGTSWGSGGSSTSSGGSGSFAVSVCSSLLQAAAVVAALPGSGPSQPLLEAAGAWLQQLPLCLLLPGGPLHLPAARWVCAAGQQTVLALLQQSVIAYCSGASPGNSVASGSSAAAGSTHSVAAAEWAAWQQQAGGLARLAMLLASAGSGTLAASGEEGPAEAQGLPDELRAADLAAAFASWADTLAALYRRPYLPAGTPERCLLLLNELLAAGLLLTAASGQPQPSPLLDWLTGVLDAAAEELAGYAGVASAAFWQPQPQAVHAPLQPATDSQRHDGRKAQAALDAASSSLLLLASMPLACFGSPAGHLEACCLQTLNGFAAAGAQDRLQPVPMDWQHAAAQLQPVVSCCRALAAAVGARQAAGWQQQQEWQQNQAAIAAAASDALDAVLALQAAASNTAAASQAAAGGGSSVRGQSSTTAGLAVYCLRLCWRAASALLELLQLLLPAQPRQPRWEQQQSAALAAALGCLQRASQVPALAADHRGLLQQLHCCRLLVPAALQQPHVAQLALSQQPSGPGAATAAASAELALVDALCEAAWQAYAAAAAAAKRRRVGLTAALVSTCLSPAVYGLGALHAATSPMQRLLERLLAVGAKSWRAMSILSLQLCGLLESRPHLACHYGGTLQQLLLWGSTDDLGQSGAGDPMDAESAAELAALIAPGDAELAAAYSSTELAPRVAALCMLRSWVQQAQAQPAPEQAAAAPAPEQAAAAAACVAAREAGLAVWHRLLALSTSDPELGAARYSPLGPVHRKKVRLWQALCVLSPLLTSEQEAGPAFEAVLAALGQPDVANVKQYQDTVALVLLQHCPGLLQPRVLPPLRDCASSGSYALSSLVMIAARALVMQLRPAGAGASSSAAGLLLQQQQQHAEQQLDEQQAGLLTEVVAAITPWALSYVHALRTFAQLVLWRLYELFPSLPAADPTAASLLHFFRENEDVNRLRRGLAHAFYFDAFDVDAAVTPAGVLCKGGSGQSGDVGFEGAPQPLLEAVQDFLAAERQLLRQDLRQSKAAAVVAQLAPAAQQQQQQQQAAADSGSGGSSNWQKKGGSSISATGSTAGLAATMPAGPAGPWAEALGSAALLASITPSLTSGSGLDSAELQLAAASEAAAAARGGPPQQLVVVASLLTKAPNLAGLARTCEVFKASALVLSDLAVTKQKEFTSIAVTAHQWVPLLEVPEPALGPWLQQQAAQGWSLVGLEQTAESVPLQAFRFPPRTVLVLGREKEGVPADILALLHHTVEIPQLGLIRSLNVHVSGAIAMFEYTRQGLPA